MRDDLRPGNPFPDLRLPDHTARGRSLSQLADGQPLVLAFVRGWWCPKEQVRLRMLVSMQEAIQREYGAIVAVTVDEPYVNGALRAGLGADFPFLSDEDRAVARELDLLELTDAKHLPYVPFTFVLDSQLHIHAVWCGFWYWGNPTPEELRQALREITRREQPTFDPQPVWQAGGAAPPDTGLDAPAVWIREDAEGREIQRGVHDGDEPGGRRRAGHVVRRRPPLARPLRRAPWRPRRDPPAQGRRAGHEPRGPPLDHGSPARLRVLESADCPRYEGGGGLGTPWL